MPRPSRDISGCRRRWRRRQQITAVLSETKSLVESLPKETLEELLQAIIRKIVVNVTAAELALKGENGIDFTPAIEKGHYLLDVQFLENPFASML